jgi:hypothetical protein
VTDTDGTENTADRLNYVSGTSPARSAEDDHPAISGQPESGLPQYDGHGCRDGVFVAITAECVRRIGDDQVNRFQASRHQVQRIAG